MKPPLENKEAILVAATRDSGQQIETCKKELPTSRCLESFISHRNPPQTSANTFFWPFVVIVGGAAIAVIG